MALKVYTLLLPAQMANLQADFEEFLFVAKRI
jgi:hypothetical protein